MIFDKQRKAVARAGVLRRAGDFHGAIAVLGDVLTDDPENIPATVEMARALRLMGDPVEAEDHLRRALKIVLDYKIVVDLAQVVAEQNRLKEADELLDGALAMAKGNPRLDPGEALVVRAALYAGNNRNEDALRALDAIPRKRASRETRDFAERLRASIGQT